MRLQQLARALTEGNLPRRAIVVTFDDGYYDNLQNAKPLLEQHDMPATVFVTSDYMKRQNEFWWDELERILLQVGTLPNDLHLSINGQSHDWELGEGAEYGADADERCRSWNYGRRDDPTPRHSLFRALYERLQALPEEEKWRALGELRRWACIEPEVRPSHRILSPQETISLADGGLVEIGTHTVSHPVLSTLPAAAQQDEIRYSKFHLEEVLGREVTSFAYPHGLKSTYTADTVALVRDAGFTCACSAFAGVVRRCSDAYELPRVEVRDVDGDAFAQRLSMFFE
jgi:peptidoglycan/xylan/chitin deacetylase (PgdA/CDA1 family)